MIPPLRQNNIHRSSNLRARIATIDSIRHERIVLCVAMPDVRLHGQIDGAGIEVLCIRRTSNPFRVHLTRVKLMQDSPLQDGEIVRLR